MQFQIRGSLIKKNNRGRVESGGKGLFDFNETDVFYNEIMLATINYLQIDLTNKRVCNFDWYQFWLVPPRRWKIRCKETWKVTKLTSLGILEKPWKFQNANWKPEQSQKPTVRCQLKTRTIPKANWKPEQSQKQTEKPDKYQKPTENPNNPKS